MLQGQRGITLVEVLVAAAIFAVVSFAAFGLLHEVMQSSRTVASNQHTHSDIAHLLDLWESDCASSESVFLPGKDVLGADNTASPHEVDFYTKDAQNRAYFWAYYYDVAAQTIQRYDYAAPGSKSQKDGAAYGNITAFAPSLHPISEISDAGSPIYFPLLASAVDHDVALGINASVVGGTHIIHIQMETPTESIPVDLQAGGAPSGFTVVLNYTPAPARSTLRTWPAAVEYGVNNNDVADLTPRWNVASILNHLLGGGVAQAASPCHSVAYTDMPGGTVDANEPRAGQPWSAALSALGISTDAAGCYGGEIVAYEADGRSRTYNPQGCLNSVIFGSWNPSGTAVEASLLVAGGSVPAAACDMTISDGGPTPSGRYMGLVVAQVVDSNCSVVGDICSFSVSWPHNNPSCDTSGAIVDGFTGTGVVQETPANLGTMSTVDGSNYTWTRTNAGAVLFRERAAFISYIFSSNKCRSTTSLIDQARFTYK